MEKYPNENPNKEISKETRKRAANKWLEKKRFSLSQNPELKERRKNLQALVR